MLVQAPLDGSSRAQAGPPRWGLRVPETPVLAADPELAARVGEGLKEGWSPHAIRAGLRSQGRTVSAETIYRAAYDHSGSSGLPEGSWRCLPRRRRHRKPRGRCTTKLSPLGDFRPVCERPAAAGDRSEPGRWEGDLIIGAGNRSAVATLVERLSLQTLAVALPDGYDAHRTADAVAGALISIAATAKPSPRRCESIQKLAEQEQTRGP